MTPAVLFLQKCKAQFELHSFENEVANDFANHAASKLGVDRQRVFKTLVVDAGNRLVVAIVPADRALDLKALANLVPVKKVKMADPAEAEKTTGYLLGAISPFGQKSKLATYLESSATGHATILVSGGRRGLEIEISPSLLVDLTSAIVGSIAR